MHKFVEEIQTELNTLKFYLIKLLANAAVLYIICWSLIKIFFEKINEDMSWLRKNSDKFTETWWWKPSVYTWYIPHSTILVYI